MRTLAAWLEEVISCPVDVRDRFVAVHATDELPEAFAKARVLSPFERETGSTMHGILQYEERALEDPSRSGGVLYDGLAIQRALNRALPPAERGLDHLHIGVLDRHLGTWGDHDGRWHKRIAILGQPALLSIPGLVEAPAKPEAYYELKQQHALMSGDTPPREILESAIDADVLVPDDPRTTEAMKGYALAAVHLMATGEAFCEEVGCRLYNAHRHDELIEAQFSDPPFCDRHAALYSA